MPVGLAYPAPRPSSHPLLIRFGSAASSSPTRPWSSPHPLGWGTEFHPPPAVDPNRQTLAALCRVCADSGRSGACAQSRGRSIVAVLLSWNTPDPSGSFCPGTRLTRPSLRGSSEGESSLAAVHQDAIERA